MFNWHLMTTSTHYEVRAYYMGGLTSLVVFADNGAAAIKKARADLRLKMPVGARVLRYVAIPA